MPPGARVARCDRVREGDRDAALAELAAAAALEPENPRYAYVRAVGLHSAGKRAEALAVLEAAAKRHPYDVDVLGALVSMNRESGNAQAALAHARKLAEVLPDDARVKRLVTDLEPIEQAETPPKPLKKVKKGTD